MQRVVSSTGVEPSVIFVLSTTVSAQCFLRRLVGGAGFCANCAQKYREKERRLSLIGSRDDSFWSLICLSSPLTRTISGSSHHLPLFHFFFPLHSAPAFPSLFSPFFLPSSSRPFAHLPVHHLPPLPPVFASSSNSFCSCTRAAQLTNRRARNRKGCRKRKGRRWRWTGLEE